MPQSDQISTKLSYPVTATVDQVDDYHGQAIADPYRWLEDPNSEESQAWIEAQNEVTFAYLNEIPIRETLKQKAIAISISKTTAYKIKAFSTLCPL
jgi:prolyl oligopeptidase